MCGSAYYWPYNLPDQKIYKHKAMVPLGPSISISEMMFLQEPHNVTTASSDICNLIITQLNMKLIMRNVLH